jgi:hypothetical protein
LQLPLAAGQLQLLLPLDVPVNGNPDIFLQRYKLRRNNNLQVLHGHPKGSVLSAHPHSLLMRPCCCPLTRRIPRRIPRNPLGLRLRAQ